jgi:hypothetical protein
MPASDQPMTSVRLATYIGGGALLMAWFAAAGSPVRETPPAGDRAQPAATSGSSSIASEVEAQASKLRERLAQAPAPDIHPRNPFSFAAPRAVRPANASSKAAAADVSPEPQLVVPALLLMGIAEEPSPDGPHRTAVIGGAGDALYMVIPGQTVADRYQVTAIGADAVELKDLITGGYRRLALR